MQTFVYIANMAGDDDRARMRGKAGPEQRLIAVRVENPGRLAENLAHHFAWNVAKVWGVQADGPYTAVSFK